MSKIEVSLPFEFDFNNPDYVRVFKFRAERLERINKTPGAWQTLINYYSVNPAQMIVDWGCTYDPRNPRKGLPSLIPFILFPRQVEWIDWCYRQWKNQGKSATVKSRDMGISWLSVAFACCMCATNSELAIGFGSRKEEYVDKKGFPKSLFWKARMFMTNLPEPLRAGFSDPATSPYMRLSFPKSRSVISGEAGDNIGRGDRASIYFIDEAAFLERPHIIDAALSQTTDCRIDVSTPNGLGNPFAKLAMSGKDVFRFHWTEDPRKDEKWYRQQVEDLDPVTVAQEIDIDFAASIEGVINPARFVQSCIDAHKKVRPTDGGWTGLKVLGYDVADSGVDTCATVGMNGSVVINADEWSAAEDELSMSCDRVHSSAIAMNAEHIGYDSIGVGASTGSMLKEKGWERHYKFNAAAKVFEPDMLYKNDITYAEAFPNLKSQATLLLAERIRNTHLAVTKGQPFRADEMLSISSRIPEEVRTRLIQELSMPLKMPRNGKMWVESKEQLKKRLQRSPNIADALVIASAGGSLSIPTFDDIA